MTEKSAEKEIQPTSPEGQPYFAKVKDAAFWNKLEC